MNNERNKVNCSYKLRYRYDCATNFLYDFSTIFVIQIINLKIIYLTLKIKKTTLIPGSVGWVSQWLKVGL